MTATAHLFKFSGQSRLSKLLPNSARAAVLTGAILIGAIFTPVNTQGASGRVASTVIDRCQVAAEKKPAIEGAADKPNAPGNARKFVYDVVSIRPAKASDGMSWKSTDDGFTISGARVRSLVMGAFDLITDDQISGLPAWADSVQFDIQAKMDPDVSEEFKKLSEKEKDRQRDLMMQAVLAERFNLKIRRETKEIPVYALMVAKGGLKLKETSAATPMGYSMNSGSNGDVLTGHGLTIENLIGSLSGAAGRLIVDKTGLTGKYDMELKWAAEDNPGTTDSGPPIFTALEEQLGLKLESTKAPVETIVVDHIDKPSEN